jgi:glycerophosphoryl diester phosphodiesterase
MCLGLAAIACNGPEVVDPPATNAAVVIAHRGASVLAPEHTTLAYDKAVEAGTDYLELDVQRTRDGTLVVIHDTMLDRTARGSPDNCTGRVSDKTLAQIETCDAGSWFNSIYPALARAEFIGLRVPPLSDIVTRYGGTTRLYVETKDADSNPGLEADLVALLRQSGISLGTSESPRVFIQSFSKESLLRVRSLEPNLALVQVFGLVAPAVIVAQLPEVRSYAAAIGVPKQDITTALVESAHASCLLVHVYVSDDQLEMQSLLAMGVDGIFTGRPDQLRAAIDRGTDTRARENGCTAAVR